METNLVRLLPHKLLKVDQFIQEHGLSQAYVHFTGMQGHSKQEFLEGVQDHTGYKDVCKGTMLIKRNGIYFKSKSAYACAITQPLLHLIRQLPLHKMHLQVAKHS